MYHKTANMYTFQNKKRIYPIFCFQLTKQTSPMHIYNATGYCKSDGIINFYFIKYGSHMDKNPAVINPIPASAPPISPYGICVKACSILSILAIAEANTV